MKALHCYEEIERRSLPHIKAFVKDLTCWDKVSMFRSPGVPFIHFTRETGTHIVMFEPVEKYPDAGKTTRYLFGYADRYRILKGVVKTVEYVVKQKNNDLILYFNGRTVMEIDAAKAVQLTLEYYNKTLDQF